MKHILSDLAAKLHRFDRNTIQLIIVIITLMLFVLVGGAPDGGGGTCTGC